MTEIMTVNKTEYTVVKLLGKGKGGYSYLVKNDDRQFVLKQIHHEPCDYYTFGDKIQCELRDYKLLKELGITIPQMIDADIENERILKEYIDGDTIFELIKKGKMQESFLTQMKEMCDLLYPANINIDYFPTNFIPVEDKLYYIDYECNNYTDQWNFENWGIKYWSLTPEFTEYVNNL